MTAPWAVGNYPAGSNAWNGQPLQSAPSYNYFTPGVPVKAEELNYILGQAPVSVNGLPSGYPNYAQSGLTIPYRVPSITGCLSRSRDNATHNDVMTGFPIANTNTEVNYSSYGGYTLPNLYTQSYSYSASGIALSAPGQNITAYSSTYGVVMTGSPNSAICVDASPSYLKLFYNVNAATSGMMLGGYQPFSSFNSGVTVFNSTVSNVIYLTTGWFVYLSGSSWYAAQIAPPYVTYTSTSAYQINAPYLVGSGQLQSSAAAAPWRDNQTYPLGNNVVLLWDPSTLKITCVSTPASASSWAGYTSPGFSGLPQNLMYTNYVPQSSNGKYYIALLEAPAFPAINCNTSLWASNDLLNWSKVSVICKGLTACTIDFPYGGFRVTGQVPYMGGTVTVTYISPDGLTWYLVA